MTDTAPNPSDCLFCRIASGALPSRRVDEDEHAFAFLDVSPFQRGHTLVVPKRHVASVLDDGGGLAEIAPLVELVSRRLVDRLGADGLNLLSSAGPVAGQEVFHLHVHLVPRYASAPGLRGLFAAKAGADDAELDAVHREILGS